MLDIHVKWITKNTAVITYKHWSASWLGDKLVWTKKPPFAEVSLLTLEHQMLKALEREKK